LEDGSYIKYLAIRLKEKTKAARNAALELLWQSTAIGGLAGLVNIASLLLINRIN